MTQTEIATTIKPNLALNEPTLYKVLYINDDVTTVDFVVQSLVDFFAYTDDSAREITELIHEQGSAVVAVLPYEIAEQKGIEVTLEARNQGYPLKVKIEADN